MPDTMRYKGRITRIHNNLVEIAVRVDGLIFKVMRVVDVFGFGIQEGDFVILKTIKFEDGTKKILFEEYVPMEPDDPELDFLDDWEER